MMTFHVVGVVMSLVPFRLHAAKRETSCAIFSSPHSGAEYPQDFLDRIALDPHEVRSSEDAFVDNLFLSATDFGAPLLAATFPRAYVDLNRAADEMDPAIIHGAVKRGMNPRIAAGLGVIPRVVSEGRAIMRGKISLADAERRVILAHEPYHRMLGQLIRNHLEKFETAVLFDCHSMPHEALASAPMVRGKRPDVILGDRFGAACDYRIMEETAQAFAENGFTVARNAPFAGGHITQFYGRPSQNVHAIQIEIDRSLYMNERHVKPSLSYSQTKVRLRRVIEQLCQAQLRRLPMAAE
jgi:N-formylglutamate amidohydrolase